MACFAFPRSTGIKPAIDCHRAQNEFTMKNELHQLIVSALQEASRELGQAMPNVDRIQIDHCKNPLHGDYASNAAMVCAKPLQSNPRALAELLLQKLPANNIVDKAEIAGPGFINFSLAQTSHMQIVGTIIERGETFGHQPCNKEKVQVEFVSANPTGPLHVGHGRGAAIGDSLCRLLAAAGHEVTREFYYNDAGAQIDNLTTSVQLRCLGIGPENEEWPEDGYRGEYISDVAASYMNGDTIDEIADSTPVTGKADANDRPAIREFSVAYLRREQDRDLKAFDVEFDVYFLESSLYEDGSVDSVVDRLQANGFCYEKDDALWLKDSELGDDKDRVMRKSSGGYTYFVPDVAYHLNKWERGFTTVINEQGSDHHGTIARVRAGLQALEAGIPQGWPDYVLHQMVLVMKNGEEVKISKRAGSYVTLRDLIDQVGKDATRYFLCSRKPDAQLTFDIDLALAKNNENPVYYIQYAHARICSAIDNAQQQYGPFDAVASLSGIQLLTADAEVALAKYLSRFPEQIAQAASERSPHLIANYLKELAALLHGWYASGNQDKQRQILVSDAPLRNARLCLAHATQLVIANGLKLLGVSAPNRM